MSTITLSPLFFRKEAKNYSNPTLGFWRELLQNSIDAGAKNININFNASDSETAVATFSDDGRGMSEDVLRNVFFSLGETTKNTEDSIGGFGKARILVCFAQDNYEIITQDTNTFGIGAEFEIKKTNSHVAGTVFKIKLNKEVFRVSNINKLESDLKYFLQRCDIKVNVTINGVLFDKNTHINRGRQVRDLGWAKLYRNKMIVGNLLLIRVSGVLMYEGYADTEYVTTLEINPKDSRNVLLSNRDSMFYTYQSMLNNLIYDINSNKRVLKETGPIVNIDNTGVVRKTITKINSELINSNHSANLVWASDSIDLKIEPKVETQQTIAYTSQNLNKTNKQDEVVDGMIHYLESENTKIKLASALWKYSNIHKNSGKGSSRRKLLGQWLIACEYAMQALIEIIGEDEKQWRIGFVFSDEAEALNHNYDGIYNLLFNPIDNDGKTKYGLRNFSDHVALAVLASHEAAHIVGPHNEKWGSVFTQIQKIILPKINQIHKEMIEVE